MWLPYAGSRLQSIDPIDLSAVDKESLFCYVGDDFMSNIMIQLSDRSIAKCNLDEIGVPGRGGKFKGILLWQPVSIYH